VCRAESSVLSSKGFEPWNQCGTYLVQNNAQHTYVYILLSFIRHLLSQMQRSIFCYSTTVVQSKSVYLILTFISTERALRIKPGTPNMELSRGRHTRKRCTVVSRAMKFNFLCVIMGEWQLES
jgi:hypothetical protein